MFENIYIHVPFCHNKCGYCVFFSKTDDTLKAEYLKKLKQDIEINSEKLSANPKTLYIGGGTPSLLNENELEFLFTTLDKNFNLSKFQEISIESNPETLNINKVEIIKNFASRISLGVQSFNSNLRDVLGRKCSNSAIYNSIELINQAKFKNFNIDLIYAIPNQTVEDFANDLMQVEKSQATHLSAYNLTIEEQSKLAKKAINIDEDLAIKFYSMAVNNSKYQQYEISNYAINNSSQCQHNLNIWQGETLLGLGPAASSFDGVNRYTQSYSIENWLNNCDIDYDIISNEDRCSEIFAVNLRTIRGWSRIEFEKLYPNKFDNFIEQSLAIEKKYPNSFSISNDKIRLTPQGLLFWDDIFMEFI